MRALFFLYFFYVKKIIAYLQSLSKSFLLLLPCDKWSYHNLTLIFSYKRTELLSLRTKTSLLTISTVKRLKDLNIGHHHPRSHRSSRGVKMKKQNVHPFIVASFNAQLAKGNDMACNCCEISTFIEDNGVDIFFVNETWLGAQGDEAKNKSNKWI